MSKAIELIVSSYVKLKERNALQHLLGSWQSTYSDLERRNSPKRILDRLAEEIEMIKAGLASLGDGDDPAEKGQPSDVKVLGIAVSAPPATARIGSPLKAGTTSAVVTGLSISVSPSPMDTDTSSLPLSRTSTKGS